MPGAQTTTEDTARVFSAANSNLITVADVDTGTLTVTVAVTNGTFSLSGIAGLTFTTGDGTTDATMTFSGTAAAINTALAGASYIPTADYNGSAQLTLTTNDGVAPAVVNTVGITVGAIADIANDAYTFNEDSTAQTLTVLGNDSFENAGHTITAVNGTAITAGGPAVAVTGGSVTLNASGQLIFTPTANYNGTPSFTYTVTSGGVTETATVNLTVSPVNDAPTNTVPGAQTTIEDTAHVFSVANGNLITVADVDTGTLTVTVAVTNGTFSLSGIAGLTFTTGDGTTDATMTFSGTAAAINTALAGASYIPTADYNGSAQLTLTTNDGVAPPVVNTVAHHRRRRRRYRW